MKETTVSLRVTKQDRQRMGKAAKGHKNLSRFLILAVNQAIKYRTLIEQAEKLGVNYTPAKLEVRVK